MSRRELSAGDCTFVFERPAAGVLVVTIRGFDKGELGDAPLKEISSHFGLGRPLELFVDASQAGGAAKEVSDAWTRFFAERRRPAAPRASAEGLSRPPAQDSRADVD
jgi:hypothetical protein